ncbi:MAG: hypothetical protein AB7O21_06180 [Gammaproteobacteria bacterium]
MRSQAGVRMRLLIAIIGACWLAGAHAGGDLAPDVDYLARLMREAELARQPFPDVARVNPALNDAVLFEVQRRYVALRREAGHPLGGFKGGFLPVAPIGGVLFRDGFLNGTPTIDPGEYVQLLVEAEIGFEFCAPVSAPLADVAALRAVVCRVRAAVELPDAAVHDLAALKADLPRLRRALIPNNVATRRVLFGEPVAADTVDVDAIPVTARQGETVLGARDPAKSAGLWQNVLWVVNEFALKQGYTVEPGFVIIPGNLTGIHAGAAGAYTVDYGPLGVVTFTVSAPAAGR